MVEKTLYLCDFPVAPVIGQGYSYHHDNLRQDRRCTSLGEKTAQSNTMAEELRYLADDWVSDGATRIEFQGVFYYPHSTPSNGDSDSSTEIIVGVAVIAILGSLYFLKKRKR